MGLQILGWSFVVIGIIITVWGVSAYPISQWLGADFLSIVVSGMVLIASGLAIIKSPGWIIIAAIIISALVLAIYIWTFQMGVWNVLISYTVITALVIWLVSLVIK